MNRQKRFRELFRFREDIRSRTPEFIFRYGGFQVFKFLLIDV